MLMWLIKELFIANLLSRTENRSGRAEALRRAGKHQYRNSKLRREHRKRQQEIAGLSGRN